MTRLLVAGAGGMVGWELGQRAAGAGFECGALDRSQLDVTDSAAVADVIRRSRPDVVINAAGYTAVDDAESDRDAAMRVNSEGAGHLARSAEEVGAGLVQISTDYVFDGAASAPYPVSHPPHPIGAYGESKLAGEEQVREATGRFAIVRTSWVFSHRGRNFVQTMLRLARGGKPVRVVSDQIGRPTAAGDLADAILVVAAAMQENPGMSGTWHFANTGETTWYDFAREIFRLAGRDPGAVTPVPTKDYPAAARRPAYSVLDTTSFEETFGLRPRDWRDALRETVEKMT